MQVQKSEYGMETVRFTPESAMCGALAHVGFGLIGTLRHLLLTREFENEKGPPHRHATRLTNPFPRTTERHPDGQFRRPNSQTAPSDS